MIAILATGDEIIHGDTLNRNAFEIAHALHSEGLVLGRHLACSDMDGDILACIDFLCQNHELLILIGGLGPTSDDRTRFALSQSLGTPLMLFPEALSHVEKRLSKAGLSMNEGNRQQALFPEGAKLLPNPYGTAMGCDYVARAPHQKCKRFILLPGPPRECLPMFNHHVLPYLQSFEKDQMRLLKWRLFGVAEGEVAAILDKSLSHLPCRTGYRLETPYLEFKVRCALEDEEKVKKSIEPLIAPHCIATIDEKASEKLRHWIENSEDTIVLLDDVTGGVLQRLLDTPDTHHKLFFYEKEAKHHVHLRGLTEYWDKTSAGGVAHLGIEYRKGGEVHQEDHEIPYRSPLVVEYAAEWLCFRLFQLFNPLH